MNRIPCDDECRRANHCGGVHECRRCGADICPMASEDGYCWLCAELMAEGNDEEWDYDDDDEGDEDDEL